MTHWIPDADRLKIKGQTHSELRADRERYSSTLNRGIGGTYFVDLIWFIDRELAKRERILGHGQSPEFVPVAAQRNL